MTYEELNALVAMGIVIAFLMGWVKRLLDSNAAQDAEMDRTLGDLRQEKGTHQDTKNILSAQTAQNILLGEANSKLFGQMVDRTNQNKDLLDQLLRLSERLGVLDERVIDLERRLSELHDRYNELADKYNDLNEKYNAVISENTGLRAEVKSKDVSIDALEQKIEDLE